MRFTLLTLFPEVIESYCSSSIISRAVKEKLIQINTVNIRDFADNKHNRVDDYPYGGGEGMLIQAEPVYRSYKSVSKDLSSTHRVIYTSPCGNPFHSGLALELAKQEDLVILCGHYEGVDQRVLDTIVTDYISIGDYVLTGGELAALVILDSTVRFVDGVLGNGASAHKDSFSNGLLEHPQYTRPVTWNRMDVPEVLTSGHHGKVRKWEREQALLRTFRSRPELLNNADLTEEDLRFLRECGWEKK